MSTSAISPNQPYVTPRSLPWTSWAAVIAGTVTAIAIQIALTELCVGLGLAMYEPLDPAAAGGAIAAGTAIAWLVSALLSIFAGAWVTGRMKLHSTHMEAAIHGTLVWAVVGILTLLLTTISLGMLAGGAMALVGKGISTTASAIGSAVPALAQAAAPSWDDVKKQLEGAADKATSSAASSDAKAPSESRFADRSRMMQLLGQTFTMDAKPQSEADMKEVTGLVAGQLGISSEAAQATLQQWQRSWQESVNRYEAMKNDAKKMALEAASVTARRTAQAAIIAFFVMIAALGAAIGGAISGSACMLKRAREDANANAGDRAAVSYA